MARRKEGEGPTPGSVWGHPWELVEAVLLKAESDAPRIEAAAADPQSPWDRFFQAVKNVRRAKDSDGTEALCWKSYGRALIGGKYEDDKVALKSTCWACGVVIAANEGRPCKKCLREHKRLLDRAVAKRYRRRHGLVTTPATLECAHCGATFTPKRTTARFCSTACRVAAHRAKASDSTKL